MDFANSTSLDSGRLLRMFERHTAPFAHERIVVRVRYSRRSAFSGSCHYRTSRIYVNLGRRLRFPYAFVVNAAKARSNRTHWWREALRLTVADGAQLALFVYLHELYHHLVKAAGRSPRRKEAMCDRFATRVLVDEYGCALERPDGGPVERACWDFQDLHRFVAAAPRQAPAPPATPPAPRPIPVRIRGLAS